MPPEPKGETMETIAVNHPHAAEAIRLAHAAQYVDRATIARQLAAHGVPARLFILARVLRAATAKGI